MKLTDDEYNILNAISSKTGEDCWFWIEEKDNEDVIIDLENDCKEINFKEALELLSDGIVYPLSHYSLSSAESNTLSNLFKRYKIKNEFI